MNQGEPEPPSDGSTQVMLAAAFAALSVATALLRYGLDTVSKSRLLHGEDETGRARMERYVEALDRTRIGVLLLWTASDAGFVLALFRLVAPILGPERFGLALGITAAVAAVLLVTFGRILPRVFAARGLDAPVRRALPVLHGVGLALSPVTVPLLGVKRLLDRMLHLESGAPVNGTFADEIIATVAEGEREGSVGEDEADIIENVVDMREVEVSEIMTPRTDMSWVASTASVFEALRYASEEKHSRIPVGEDDSDHIVGVFYVRDVVDKLVDIETIKHLPVKQVCRKPFYVPESKNVSDMLREFKENKIHMAIVLDEYGGTSGLITIEDVLEEIVGEIDDEYDSDEETPVLDKLGPDRAQVDARIYIEDLNDALEIHLPDDADFDTVGGFVFSHLGRVPQRGERFAWENLDIQVLDADDRRVKLLEVNVLERDLTNGRG
ncbi:MAG: hemolysin family protein [Planctomycetota bacterium JB042]